MIDFSKRYDQVQFIDFFRDFLPDDANFKQIDIEHSDNSKLFRSVKLIGECKSLNEIKIIEASHRYNIKRKIEVFREISKLISRLNYKNVLLITHDINFDQYRLSLIRNKISVINNSVKDNFTSFNRHSFLLGPGSKIHTPYNKLKDNIKSFEDLIDRFSVEVVTEDFFKHYKERLNSLQLFLNKDKEFVKYSSDNQLDIELFAKKLMGQIVFCYFLQKKKLLGANKYSKVYEGDPDFLRNQFQYCVDAKKNFFNDILEYLFYEGLNKKNENDFCENLNCKVPYLNGGLFQSLDNYDWKKYFLNIPNKIFSNLDQIGILDVFDLYNFTVDENSDLDKDIAVDPEMLGKIFESLLPENIKKEQGTHYTPKCVVDYITLNSIELYVKNNIENEDAKLITELFIYAKSPEDFIYNFQLGKIQTKLLNNNNLLNKINLLVDSVKICDPAVGSGAFILGSLHSLINIKKLIYLLIDKTFINVSNLKRKIIQNNLYGVDIDLGAIEVCKLRLWLNLIINDESKIEILPNLDFKIVQGNSLVEEFYGVDLNTDFKKIEQLSLSFNNSQTESDIVSLQELQQNYFNETSEKVKKYIFKNISNNFFSIIKNKIQGDINLKIDKKETLIENIKNIRTINEFKNFFAWNLIFFDVFIKRNGFDIIVANPPYLKERNNAHIFKDVNESKFGKKFHSGKMDFWYYFLFKASDKINKKGVISFITHSYWINGSGSKKLIEHIKKNLFFYDVVNLNNIPVFQRIKGNHMIFTLTRMNHNFITYKDIKSNVADITSQNNKDSKKINNQNIYISSYINFNISKINYDFADNLDKNYLCSQGVVEAPDKISKKMHEKINGKDIEVNDGVFVLSKEEVSKLNLSNEEQKVLVPYIKSNQINRFTHKDVDNYLIYSDSNIKEKIKNGYYKKLKKHINKYKQYITSSNGPYGLHRPRKVEFFKNKKIIFKNMFFQPEFSLDLHSIFFGMSLISIIRKKNLSLEYLLGLLNSKYGFYWFLKNSKRRGIGFDVTIENLRLFPVPIIDKNNEKGYFKIIEIVKELCIENDTKLSTKLDYEIYKLCKFKERDIEILDLEISDWLKGKKKLIS